MSQSFSLEEYETLWVLGLLPTAELPKVAANALAGGIESKSLVELARCSPAESDEARRLFNQSIKEITGKKGMLKTEALRRYAKRISASILTSELLPLAGAKLIWRATLNAGVKQFHELDAFIYAASELEDRPQDRQLFENAIIEEARRWSKLPLPRFGE